MVMYGASLTKAVFAYFVMQLVQDGALDLQLLGRRIQSLAVRHRANHQKESRRYDAGTNFHAVRDDAHEMKWETGFEDDYAIGYDETGKPLGEDELGRVYQWR